VTAKKNIILSSGVIISGRNVTCLNIDGDDWFTETSV